MRSNSKLSKAMTKTKSVPRFLNLLEKMEDSVFSNPKEEATVKKPSELFSTNDANTTLENISFDRQDILDMIDKLSSGASAGPDGIPQKMQTC